MEILQFLLVFLLDEYGGKELEPLLDTFRENEFDIKKSLNNISPKELVPIIKFFLAYPEKKHSSKDDERFIKLSPIKKIANKEIFDCLNNYFENLA